MKRRFSIMAINDDTNPNNAYCGNVTGMCCSNKIMEQREILVKTQEAYNLNTPIYCTTSSRESTVISSSRTAPNQNTNYQTPLIDRNQANNQRGAADFTY